MRTRRVFAFAPGVHQVTYGSSIRTLYLLAGLQESGFQVESFERDLFPRTAIRLALGNQSAALFASNTRLPLSLVQSNVMFFEGLPKGPITRMLLAWAKLSDRELVLDFCDDPVLQYRDLVGHDAPSFDRLISLREEFFELSSCVIFPSESFREHFLRSGAISKDRTSIVKNSADPSHFIPAPLPEQPIVGLVSGCSPGRGMETLAEASHLAREGVPDLQLTIATSPTSSSEREYLSQLRKSLSSSWISIREDVTYADVSPFLSGCYVCVVPHPDTVYMNMVLPIKLFDYMAASRPVIVSRCWEMSNVVREERCGLIYDHTVEDLARKLVKLISEKSLAESMGRRGRMAVEREYNWGERGSEVSRVIEGLS